LPGIEARVLARSIAVIASSTASPDFISFRPGFGCFTLHSYDVTI
jgi:hypothetical protein